MDLIVFNVEHGLCAFVRTPSGHGVMIDIGCSPTFKPAEWLSNTNNITISMHGGFRLSWLVVTHPHDDHVEGIASMRKFLRPAILLRHDDYDWNAVLNPADGDPSLNAKEYHGWQQTYNQLVTNYPALGCTFEQFSLTPSQSAVAGGQLQNVLNNSSYVCVFTWDGGMGYQPWKVVVCGDNETKGLEYLLLRDDFRNAIAGANILVTPHHGHSSGFCPAFMEALGNVRLCISSLPAKDQHYDERYADYASGMTFNGENRKHLTTRRDGHIWLEMLADQYNFKTVSDPVEQFATALARSLNR